MLPLSDVNPTRRTPFVTWALVLACLAVWGLWQQEPQRSSVQDLEFALEYAAVPCEVVEGRPLTVQELTATYGRTGGDTRACDVGAEDSPPVFPAKRVWLAVFTSMFLHGGLLHIGGNLLYLWIFGNNIEDHLGHVRYLGFYLLGGVAAAAAHIGFDPASTVPVLGASGAIAAVMGAYLVWFPRAPVRTVLLLGFPVLATIQARWLLSFWFVLQFFTSPNSGVAWAAHVGGFAFGVVTGLVVRIVRPVRRAAWTPDYAPPTGAGGWDDTGGVGQVRTYRRWSPGRRP